MIYIDAIHVRDHDLVKVVERVNGKRQYMDYKAKYVFYHKDEKGKHRNIFGDRVTKFQTNSNKKFRTEKSAYYDKDLFEADINPVFRCLADHYMGCDNPKLNVCFFDIEVDFDPKVGYSRPEDPQTPITAISCWLSWTTQMITLVMPPPTVSWDRANEICAEFENTLCFKNEKDLLEAFYELIEEADILSGWNSTFFDIPYIIRRTEMILTKEHTKKLCLWGRKPRKRMLMKFNREVLSYDLVGRVHLDYLDLYRKHTYQERHSYRLDFIGEVEVGEGKTVYEGSLDDLYKKDFKLFIEYNRKDVDLLVKIDAKLSFIELSNQLAHQNTVLFKTTLGSVALIEQAIINEAHERNMVVPNRKTEEEANKNAMIIMIDEDDPESEEAKSVAGAYVAEPQEGMHDWIGSIDINSLYPSVIRSLNMGPETLVGQIRQIETEKMILKRYREQQGTGPKKKKASIAECWGGVFATIEYEQMMEKANSNLVLDLESGEEIVLPAHDLYNFIFNQDNPYCVSSNGTVFKTDVEGVIPGLLRRWYTERQDMQKRADDYYKQMEKATDVEEKKQLKSQFDFWNMRQHSRKILLNSLYGALLNETMRFYDPRIGQSVTLTGRTISRHMASVTNEIIVGEKDYTGEAIVYGDTDSVYFSAYKPLKDLPEFSDFEWKRDNIVDLYDSVGEGVNKTFKQFMMESFHVPPANGAVIAAGREVVASKGLFISKKRYALMVIDDEGKKKDIDGKPGKIKAMGIETKRTDTPKIMQDFLQDMLERVLAGETEEEIIKMISEFRTGFKELPGYQKGSPKAIKSLTEYTAILNNGLKDRTGKKRMIPGNARASINYNKLREAYGDKYSMPIADGYKIIICKLKDNPMGYTSIAYPVDELNLPDWFKDLPFDDEAMETTLIDTKVDNLIGVLGWDLSKSRNDTSFNKLFTF